MTTKEITICGQKVKVTYCYAVEIAFNDLAHCEMPPFIQESALLLDQKKGLPDVKKVIFAIIASMIPCYDDGTEAPVKDKDIMLNADPKEMIEALGTIIMLYADFYHIPYGEPEDKKSKSKPKNSPKEKNV